MLRLTSNITIRTAGRNYTFDFVTEVEIESSWENMTTTATLILPSNVRESSSFGFLSSSSEFLDAEGIESLFSVGDEIDILLGYDENLIEEFAGYITEVVPGQPVKLICQDGIFTLKRRSIKFPDPRINLESENNVDLETLLQQLIQVFALIGQININPGVESLSGVKLGKFRIKGETSFSEILEQLKDYGLAVYFRGRNDLFVLPPTLGTVPNILGAPPVFNFTRNVIADGALRLVNKEFKKQKVVAVSNDSETNEAKKFPSDTEIEETDNVLKINFPENLSESDLEFYTNAKQDQDVYNGFEGSFLSFGEPFTRHGETVRFVDENVPERNGNFLIKKTIVKFGTRGFRREVFPWRESL